MRFFLALVLIGTVLGLAFVVVRNTGNGQSTPTDSGVAGTLASTSTTLASGSSSSTTAPGSGDTTLTTAPLSVIRPLSASASSSLSPTNTNNFRPQNLLDDDLHTVWSEGAKGPGLGESVRFDFAQPTRLARIEIANGNQKTKVTFTADPRVRTIKLEYSSGATQFVELRDTEDLQYLNTLQTSTEWIRLTIVSVYPNYTTPDTSLSEVRFYELPAQL